MHVRIPEENQDEAIDISGVVRQYENMYQFSGGEDPMRVAEEMAMKTNITQPCCGRKAHLFLTRSEINRVKETHRTVSGYFRMKDMGYNPKIVVAVVCAFVLIDIDKCHPEDFTHCRLSDYHLVRPEEMKG